MKKSGHFGVVLLLLLGSSCNKGNSSSSSAAASGTLGAKAITNTTPNVALVVAGDEAEVVSTEPDGGASSVPPTLDPTTFHIPAVFPPAPDVTSTQPEIISIQPEITSTQPEITSTQPEITSTQPEITSTQPEIISIQPEIISIQPEIISTQPNVISPSSISLLARSSFGIEGSIYTPANMASSTPTWNNISSGPGWSDVNGWGKVQYYSTIRSINVGGKIYVFGRSAAGVAGFVYDPTARSWTDISAGPDWSDVNGWGQVQYYSTIQLVSLNEKIYVFGRSAAGIAGSVYDTTARSWTDISAGPGWSDVNGWGKVQYYSTIQSISVGGKIYVFGRSAAGIAGSVYDTTARSWTDISAGPAWSDKSGWGEAKYYSTIQLVSLNEKIYVFARSAAGIESSLYDPTSTAQSRWTNFPTGIQLSDSSGWGNVIYYSTIRLNPFSVFD